MTVRPSGPANPRHWRMPDTGAPPLSDDSAKCETSAGTVGAAMQPSTVLAVLAELAPAGGDRVLDVTRGGQPLAWLDDAERAPRRAEIERLAALSALHRDERILRRGWGFLAGRIEVEGKA